MYPLDAPERTAWAYVPGKRKGISWGEMSDPQRAAAVKLLKAALSAEGYTKVEAIRQLEPVLAEMENGNKERDPNRYWFVFFGSPGSDAPWVWRYEGHHVSLTFGNQKGAMVSSTPQFLGSNPAQVLSGPHKGERVLAMEQDLGFKVVESLSPAQSTKAILEREAPTDIITAAARNAAIDGHLGVPYGDLRNDQKRLLMELIRAHAEIQTKSEQKRRLDAVAKEGLDNIVFAWIGPIDRHARHYYRIQGNTFLIEFDNTQSDGNHIHTVWRDFKGDFGEDALAEHYAEDHHH